MRCCLPLIATMAFISRRACFGGRYASAWCPAQYDEPSLVWAPQKRIVSPVPVSGQAHVWAVRWSREIMRTRPARAE